MGGYVKIYRDLYEHPIVHKDNDYLSVWIYLLLNASHSETDTEFNGKIITLKKGQLVRGRLQISEKAKVEQSKVERILKRFIFEQMIEQQTCTKKRLITILNWSKYQINEQQDEQEFEQQVNNKRTTSEQQMNTYNNDNNEIIKELKNKDLKIKIERLKFVKPTIEELDKFINANYYKVDSEAFYDYYESNGWVVGKNKMKSWEATVRTWNRNNANKNTKKKIDIMSL
jgi:hypothetical protein